ncbi:MAG: hypothetical protein JSS54_07675 [Proteobacteria bacterium]|nr:hypothetical protein [Pseudomonadota bacterium]MBS0268843.1 hypothetical protein [Pseudomonadota bacterium]
MQRFLSTLARVLFGFVLASLAAGLVTVLFVTTPVEVFTEPFERLPKTASETFDLALLAATHLGIFASVFVLIVALLSEVFSVRSLTFYLFAGVAIAMLGFTAQYQSEVAGQPTILNNYAIKAFLTIGFFGGFFYWLAAGQFAGRPYGWGEAAAEPVPIEAGTPARKAESDAEVVITRPPVEIEQARFRKPLLQRLKFSRPSVTQDPAADPAPREPAGMPEDNSRNS